MMATVLEKKSARKRVWWALGAFLTLSAAMYGSIMYKIIHYGP